VLTQFLAEAIVLSLFGGLIGIVMGLSLAWLGTSVLQVPLTINPGIILLAFAFSTLVGIVFGYFPRDRQLISIPSMHCDTNDESLRRRRLGVPRIQRL
jgi:putative ABC transport system permease protein